MPDVVQSPKNKRRFSGLMVLILIITITLVAVFINTALRRSLNESERVNKSLVQLQGLAYRLSALEWQSISIGQMEAGIIEDVQATRDEMHGIMGELEQFDPTSEKLLSVRRAFTTYDSAIVKEFELIATGNLEQAQNVDEEQVDPAFEILEEELTSASTAYDSQASQIKQGSDLGFTLLLLFIAIATALVFWQFQKAQTASEREHVDELKAVNMELEATQQNLEQRVAGRMADLESATTLIQRRARQFEAIAQISRAITSAQNLKELLPRISEAISQQFGFYHVGIFLNDPSAQYTVLAAANSPGGKKMLELDYRVNIGEQGIVGYVTGTGTPRMAFDAGEDVAFFNNPNLPASHSEMALPLKIAGKTIGALDVQSTETSAFTNEDITSLSILADQVSTAIENARLYEATRKSLEQTEATYRQYAQNEWTTFAREEKLSGFHYVDGNSAPLKVPIDLGGIAQIVNNGNIHQSEAGTDGKAAQVIIPVKLRGEVIGVLRISTSKKTRWTDDDIDIAEAVAERLALALENARLFRSSANRATRERIVSDISSKISGNIRIKDILQMTAQELSQALNGMDVLIQLQPGLRDESQA